MNKLLLDLLRWMKQIRSCF